MREGLEGFWAIVGSGRGGRVFALGGCEGGGGFWTGAGEACQCRSRSYGYVRKSNELRIARVVNLVTELVCPGGGASNAEQARQDGGWRRSCIPSKKRGPPPGIPCRGSGLVHKPPTPASSRNKSDGDATAQTAVCGPAARSAMGCPRSEMARASKICLL